MMLSYNDTIQRRADGSIDHTPYVERARYIRSNTAHELASQWSLRFLTKSSVCLATLSAVSVVVAIVGVLL